MKRRLIKVYLGGVISGLGIALAFACFSTLSTSICMRNSWGYCDSVSSPSWKNGLNNNTSQFSTNHDAVSTQDTSAADELFRNVRILCWVMTSPQTLRTKAIHVRETWGKRCNKLVFASSERDDEFPAVGLNVDEGRTSLYEKSVEAFLHVWIHHRDAADWFLKTDDDTYIITENLRYMLRDYNPTKPMYFGRKFRHYVDHGYMSGGAGYVLSKEALRRFVEAIHTRRCRKNSGPEDIEMGQCLSSIGVAAMDSRDENKREKFFPYAPQFHLLPGKLPPNNWFWRYIYYPNPSGEECCSDHAISFHYIYGEMMRVFDYFLYRLHPYGIERRISRNTSVTTTYDLVDFNDDVTDAGFHKPKRDKRIP